MDLASGHTELCVFTRHAMRDGLVTNGTNTGTEEHSTAGTRRTPRAHKGGGSNAPLQPRRLIIAPATDG